VGVWRSLGMIDLLSLHPHPRTIMDKVCPGYWVTFTYDVD